MKRFLALVFGIYCSALLAVPPDVPDSQDIVDALNPKKVRSIRNVKATDPSVNQDEGELAPLKTRDAGEPPPSVSLVVLFDFGSTKISKKSESTLRNLATALVSPQLNGSRFLIEGHTDAKGGAAYNLKLSQQRAESVRRWLSSHGVNAESLIAAGRGAKEPANPDEPLAPENRRVKVVNLL